MGYSENIQHFYYNIYRYQVDIYLFELNGNTRTMCQISSQLTIKPLKRRQNCSGDFIVNFEQILHLALVIILLTLNK